MNSCRLRSTTHIRMTGRIPLLRLPEHHASITLELPARSDAFTGGAWRSPVVPRLTRFAGIRDPGCACTTRNQRYGTPAYQEPTADTSPFAAASRVTGPPPAGGTRNASVSTDVRCRLRPILATPASAARSASRVTWPAPPRTVTV